MRKLFTIFSLIALVAILGFSTVSAQKTVATIEKLWSKTTTEMGVTISDTRQGAGRDGKVYLLNKADQSFVAVSESSVDTIFQGPLEVEGGVWANLDGTAYALDDAGNFVMEGTFPNTPSHLVLRKADGSIVKDLAITGLKRTDFINATGDVFSAEGGYVFVYGNNVDLLVYTIANGALVGEPTTVTVSGVAGGNYVVAGDANTQIFHHRTHGTGWVIIENGVETLIEGMEGFKNTTLGGDIITLAGKEFYIYPAGTTNYNSEFVVRNMTDGTLVADKTGATIFYSNTTSTANFTITACWLNASKIDDNSAYIHVYNSDGAAVFKLSIVPAATISLNVNDTTMGVVEGAGDVAVGGSATVKATPNLGHSFVAWLNGTDTVSTKAEYTFDVKEDVALTAVFTIVTLPESRISVTDGTLSDWDQLPQEYVSTCICPEGASYVGLLSMKAYADEKYINLAVEYNPEAVTDLSWPGFHVCIDTDNSASTGGYGDQWTIGAFDVLLETAVFADGQPYPYNPGVYWWWGAVGENGWAWTNPNVEPTPENCWGLIVCEGSLPVGNSQLVGNTFEIQLNRELIPTSPEAPWSDVINIGVDIQQNWSSVGILPITTANETDWGKADPLTVQIDEGPGRITYELNGGVTNGYRWQNKNDMFQSFMKSAGVSFPFSSLDDLKLQGADAFTTICAKLLNEHVNNIMSQKKWDWLWAYIMAIQNADVNATHLERGVPSAGWRYAIAAFFLESQQTGWPASADFSTAGSYDAFKLAWKQGFKNPKNPTEEYVLNAPYREGYVFEGWYANEDLSGEVVTTVDSETSGTLYAKWGTVPMATLTLTTNQPEMGEVSGPTEGVVNGLVTFSANAYDGYEFIRWVEDGNTDNPRSIFLTKDTTFTAEFAERKVHISTNSDMWEWGTTQGDTAVAAGETVTLTAIPNEGYQFTHWYTYDMYGNYQEYYENPLVIQADRFDQVFTAAFLAPQYALSVNYDPAQCNVYWHNNMYGWGGYFSYSGEQIWVDANSEIVLSVEPFDGCTFEKWNDGNTDNPRYITLSSDTTFTAEFAARQVTISTGSNDWGWGTTKGDTVCFSGDSITLIATPYPGYYLAYWETYDIYGNYQQYYGDTISILAALYDQYFTAWFEPIRYALTIDYDPAQCNVYWHNHSTGEGNILNYGEQIWSWENSFIELYVEPLDGYTFAGWSDGNYENPRYFTMEAHDTIVPSPKLLGVCGYNLCWDYTYGMLDIIGDGDMYDYTTWTLPWQQYAHQIYSISLPYGMTSIGASAFADCRFLESVTIPATVREIRYSAFENNRMLSTVNFAAESALTTIGNWAFYNCHELKNITIPEGVTEIGYAAFYGCTYMSELSLPESMQYIADNGFALCSKLRRMNVAASTPPTVAARTFEDVDRAIPVYVPTESVGLYKAAPVWQEFNIVGRDNAPTSVENTEVNSSNVQKIFRDGQVLIIRDGKTYSVIGQEME